MIKSMTGFASLTREDEGGSIGLTVRAVNHRFLDLQLRLPSALADVEEVAQVCAGVIDSWLFGKLGNIENLIIFQPDARCSAEIRQHIFWGAAQADHAHAMLIKGFYQLARA